MSEVLDGQGATKERLQKSTIRTAPRLLTKGGMVLTYGQHDEEHCALDVLLAKGFIERDHFDAGYELRNIYYSFTKTGKWIDEGSPGYEGDLETPGDIARQHFHDAMQSIERNRPLIRSICVDLHVTIPADYNLIMDIQHGLGDLVDYFKNNSLRKR